MGSVLRSFWVDEHLWWQVKKKAAHEEKTLTKAITDALKDYLEKN